MTTLNLTQRQVTILGLALTVLYDEIAKSGEGEQMRDDIMEFSRYIQKQYNEEICQHIEDQVMSSLHEYFEFEEDSQ